MSTLIDTLKAASDALADAADAVADSDMDANGERYTTLRGYQDGVDALVDEIVADQDTERGDAEPMDMSGSTPGLER